MYIGMISAVVFYGSTSVPVFAGQLLDRDSSLVPRSFTRRGIDAFTNCLPIIAKHVKKWYNRDYWTRFQLMFVSVVANHELSLKRGKKGVLSTPILSVLTLIAKKLLNQSWRKNKIASRLSKHIPWKDEKNRWRKKGVKRNPRGRSLLSLLKENHCLPLSYVSFSYSREQNKSDVDKEKNCSLASWNIIFLTSK